MDDFIITEDTVWVPLEVTAIQGGFSKAWQEGAKEWRENDAHNAARMFPVHKAWSVYEPVGIFEKTEKIAMPPQTDIETAFRKEYSRFIEREIYPMVTKLESMIEQRGETPRLINRFGVIYAKYGIYNKAEAYFEKAIAQSDYIPAFINIGNMYFLNGEMEKAHRYYNEAYQLQPEHPTVLLCVARTNHELENYGLVSRQYQKLKEIHPRLAEQFSYLEFRGEEATARAAEIGGKRGTVLWEEE
jgi:tetratricopeptide (TPR) repeat protein